MKWQIVYSVSNRQYHLRFVASNGRIIVWSENYVDRAGALSALGLLQTYAATAPLEDVRVA